MQVEPGDRLLGGLPAVFHGSGERSDLAILLGVFEALMFSGSDEAGAAFAGLERQLPAIPALFAPLGGTACEGDDWRTPEHFLHWLAAALAFTPHGSFTPAALRRIIAGIVPLYGWRGTQHYLARLLALCFDDEVAAIHVDDRPRVGFTIGVSLLGQDTRLATRRPYWFKVVVETHDAQWPQPVPNRIAALERRLREVIDFAKPAHTAYEIELRPKPAQATKAAPAPAREEHDG